MNKKKDYNPILKYPYPFMKGDLQTIETIIKQKENFKKSDIGARYTVWWLNNLNKYIFTPNISKEEILKHFGIEEKIFNEKVGNLFLGVDLSE